MNDDGLRAAVGILRGALLGMLLWALIIWTGCAVLRSAWTFANG